jgi:hypothetical protein
MQNPDPSPDDMRKFAESMAPRWNEITLLLAADRPPDWYGLKFTASIQHGTGPEFSIGATYADRLSNRKRFAPKSAVDKLAKLYVAYRNFSRMTEWKSVVIEQIWVEKSRSWNYETRWEYAVQSGPPGS